MATKPTRQQDQACQQLAEALVLLTGAARLDGRGTLGVPELNEIATRLAKASSAFALDDIVARAIERRVTPMGLGSGAADMLVLIEGDIPPLAMLLLSDDELRARVEAIEAELGEI